MSLNIEIGGVGANRHQEEQTLLLKGVVGKIRLKTLLVVSTASSMRWNVAS